MESIALVRLIRFGYVRLVFQPGSPFASNLLFYQLKLKYLENAKEVKKQCPGGENVVRVW